MKISLNLLLQGLIKCNVFLQKLKGAQHTPFCPNTCSSWQSLHSRDQLVVKASAHRCFRAVGGRWVARRQIASITSTLTLVQQPAERSCCRGKIHLLPLWSPLNLRRYITPSERRRFRQRIIHHTQFCTSCVFMTQLFTLKKRIWKFHTFLWISRKLENEITRVVSTYIQITVNISKVTDELMVKYSAEVFP